MHPFHHHSPSRVLALALVLAAGCDNQITQPPGRLQPSDALQADRAPFKSVVALEPLPGISSYSYSAAHDINDLGQVVGESNSIAGFRAVIWDNSNIPQDLGTLPGHTTSGASEISNDGRVIAGVSGDGNIYRPVRWLKFNDAWLIDPLPNSGSDSCNIGGMSPDGTAITATCNSIAYVWFNGSRIFLGAGFAGGVNGKGQAVGTNSAFTHALLWNFATLPVTVTDLGTLGGSFAVALDINETGEVTGWSENASQVSHAFLWSPKRGVMTDLGQAGITGGGYAINAAGQVVGDMFPSTQHGGFYDHGKVVDLAFLPGYQSSIAVGINNTGQAVGWSSDFSNITRATKWTLK